LPGMAIVSRRSPRQWLRAKRARGPSGRPGPIDGVRCGVTRGARAIPPQNLLEVTMDTNVISISRNQSTHSTAFEQALTPESLRERVPAVFAPGAHERTSKAYTFISTERVLDGLRQVGFLPVEARQSTRRVASPLHARHLIRLRRRFETVQLREAVPEIWFLNSHDGTSAYQLRVGLYRAVCTNGLVVSVGTFPVWRIAHRGDVLEDVVRAAQEIGERFATLGTAVERMERTMLTQEERLDFAAQACLLRFPRDRHVAMEPAQLLVPRRPEDVGGDLWHTLNIVQEGIIAGGLTRRSASGRTTRTRRITAIREDVRLNAALWDLAMARAA